jgi:hypothetical protein
MYSFGIVGLPNVGKSTLFNLLTRSSVPVEKYPFSTKDHHVGAAQVPDSRMGRLEEVILPIEVRPACIEFVDIAGLVEGASKGEGLGNRFLAHIREVNCIVEVLRCFRDPTVSHFTPNIDPVRDIDIVNTELILKDLETVSKRIGGLHRILRTSHDRRCQEEMDLLRRLEEWLNQGHLASTLNLTPQEKESIKDLNLLTLKPFLYVANLDEEDIKRGGLPHGIEGRAERDGAVVVGLSLKVELELSYLGEKDERLFREDLGMGPQGTEVLIHEGLKLLGLISFFTIEHSRLSAWIIPKGTTAREAAGKIHSDMERGFVAAEVTAYEHLLQSGSLHKVKEGGLLRLEGRDYIVQDGDIITFRFNV